MFRALTAVQAEASSHVATILAVVTSIAGMFVGLGLIGPHVEGIIIACTTDGIVVVGLITNAIHSDRIEPSAFITSVIALVTQILMLIVAFGFISNATASHVFAIASAVVIAVAQVAHALLSRAVVTAATSRKGA